MRMITKFGSVQVLNEGMAIQKLHLVATSDSDPDWQVDFSLDTMLVVSDLRLRKPRKYGQVKSRFCNSSIAWAYRPHLGTTAV